MRIRDPLGWIPIRYKLPLTFVFLCLLAFGLGGFAVTSTIRQSLGERIHVLLNERADSMNRSVEQSLTLISRRTEDFASDGHIRMRLEQLLAADTDRNDAEHAQIREELLRHLSENKLPLVAGFEAASLLDAAGVPVVTTAGWMNAVGEEPGRDTLRFGPLVSGDEQTPFPHFVVSSPVTSIRGGAPLGYIQIMVRADRWARSLIPDLELRDGMEFTTRLEAPGGFSIPLVPANEDRAERAELGTRIHFDRTIDLTGWQLRMAIDPSALSGPVDTLLQKLYYVGLALILLTLSILLFPQQFLLKPLGALQNAARRIAGGDFSERVEIQSKDEVGELAQAFNLMAGAVEERTRTLQQTAQDLKRREIDVRFERDRLNTVIRSMEDGLFILDAHGHVTLSNAAARPVLKSMSASLGARLASRCGMHKQGVTSCLECVANFDNDTHGCVVTVEGRTYEINGTALPGVDEALAGKIFVSRDVTARVRRAEQEAHQERLSVLGEIAAVMAHELNNPLAAISMFSQMLLKGLDGASSMHSHAEVIHRNTESCKATIRALLDMATTSTIGYEEFDLNALVEDVIQLLAPVAQRSGVTMRFASKAEPPTAFGDELQLRQVVVNLVMNAIQSLGNRVDATVSIETQLRDQEIAIVVCDNGPGVDAAIRQQIFEPFFTTKSAHEGTGLGLPTSRRITESQGGRLNLSCAEPGRTEFEVIVPRKRLERPAQPDLRPHPRLQTTVAP